MITPKPCVIITDTVYSVFDPNDQSEFKTESITNATQTAARWDKMNINAALRDSLSPKLISDLFEKLNEGGKTITRDRFRRSITNVDTITEIRDKLNGFLEEIGQTA